ncbi:MAG: prepilin peptidase [Leptospirales bacterium]|nr:prepilin peptidase [Leptospirales bacterium]
MYTLYFIAGTFAGSFFYTLAIRYSTGAVKENPYKALFSLSACPNCGKKISPVYLIPIIGYIILRGRCSFCKNRISISYPLMEALYGILALLVAYFHGTNLVSLFVYLICAVSITIAVIDFKTMIIPFSLIIVFVILSIYPVIVRCEIKDNIYGLLFLTVIFLIIMFMFPGSFGGGDLKFYAAAGLLLGFEMSIVLLEVSLITGAFAGVIWAGIHRWNFKIKMPFGPFISVGVIITLLFGHTIILYYSQVFGL